MKTVFNLLGGWGKFTRMEKRKIHIFKEIYCHIVLSFEEKFRVQWINLPINKRRIPWILCFLIQLIHIFLELK